MGVQALDGDGESLLVDEAQAGITHFEDAIEHMLNAMFALADYVLTQPHQVPLHAIRGDLYNTTNVMKVISQTVAQMIDTHIQ